MDRIIVFPFSLSSWRLEIMMEELGLSCNLEKVDMFEWEHLQPSHLRLSASATVPVLVTEEGRPLTGDEIFHYLQSVSTSQSVARPSSDVSKFCRKLDEVNIGVLTYGLAFHTKHTKLLRFPYCKEDFFEKSSNYILSRAERLREAADLMRPENEEIASQLRDISNDHQENLPSYIDEEGYETVLKTLEKVLDFFEDELGRDDREGRWLGGAKLSLADVTLGLYLHRLYQLGLEGTYFQDGVRPHLSVFYQSVKTRPSFVRVTDWKNRISEERRVLSEEDKILENAKWGVGIAAVLGKMIKHKRFLLDLDFQVDSLLSRRF